MQDTEYTKKDLSIQCIQYIVHGFIIARGTHSSFQRNSMGIFFWCSRNSCFVCSIPFFVISFIFFTFDNILYAQKHHSRSKLISLRLKNHINIRLQLQIADYHISLFIIYKRLRLQSMQNTDLINPCNRGTKPNSSLLLTRS